MSPLGDGLRSLRPDEGGFLMACLVTAALVLTFDWLSIPAALAVGSVVGFVTYVLMGGGAE